MNRILYLGAFVFLGTITSHCHASDPVLDKLETAISKFEEVVKSNRELALKRLDSSLSKAQAAGDLTRLKQLRQDRDTFEAGGSIPSAVATQTFERRIGIARRQLESAYKEAVRSYTRKGNVESAELIQEELERFQSLGVLTAAPIDLLAGGRLDAWAMDANAEAHWKLDSGVLRFDGDGGEKLSIATKNVFKNFSFRCEWRIGPGGDSGVLLRGKPQVQIWDHTSGKGKGIGSGGLYNNKRFPRAPVSVADRPPGQWNSMTITMVGNKVTVGLNGKRVVNAVTMENYPKYRDPFPAEGPILLQAFNSPVEFRRVTIIELP